MLLTCVRNELGVAKKDSLLHIIFDKRADRAGSRVQVDQASQVITGGYCRTIGTPVRLEGSEKIWVQVRGTSPPHMLCYDLGEMMGSELGALVAHVKATVRVDWRMSLPVGV